MLFAGVVGGSAALVLLQQHNMRQERKELEKVAPKVRNAQWAANNLHLHTGIYNDVSQVIDLINQPGEIVAEEPDTDLQGVPFRWLHTRIGGTYRCYDTKLPKVFAPK
jgi:hypothetical protein